MRDQPSAVLKATTRTGRLYWPSSRSLLEGLVSKRRDRPYQTGRSKHWVKVKNRKHRAVSRVMELARLTTHLPHAGLIGTEKLLY